MMALFFYIEKIRHVEAKRRGDGLLRALQLLLVLCLLRSLKLQISGAVNGSSLASQPVAPLDLWYVTLNSDVISTNITVVSTHSICLPPC